MKSSHDIRLAGNLKRILAEKQFTVSVAAKQAGMNKSTLHGYCNGVVPRNLLKICDLADLLDVSFDELVFGPVDQATEQTQESFEGHFEILVRRVSPSRRKSDPRER